MTWSAKQHTTGGGEAIVLHMVLCLSLALLWLGGCQASRTAAAQGAPPHTARLAADMSPQQPLFTQPARVAPVTNEPVRAAAEAELGREAAEQIPVVERPAPRPADPNAVALVQEMLARAERRVAGDEGVMRIGLWQLRNQSRSTPQEFAEFCERFAALLNRAASDARGGRVEFTCDERQTVQYHLQGTAYLISAGGFDAWELFLSMSPVEKNWSVWQAARPVRVLRHPRPGQAEILSR